LKLAVTTLVFCVAALLALGMVMLYSASAAQAGARYLAMQGIWCLLGLGACVAAAAMDYRVLKRIWWVLLGAAILMLVLVLVPHVGVVHGKARRWFGFGRVSFQPSEFAKLALIVGLAWYAEQSQRVMRGWKRGIVLPGLVIVLMAGLIFKEPDVGNALVLLAVGSAILLVGGIRLAYFLPPILVVLMGVGLFIYQNPMRSERIYSWLHLEETKRDKGMQAFQAMLALGSGGILGKGLGDSRQKLGFVPEQHTDFIFSIIGEELGLIATMLVLAAFVGVILSGIYVAQHARDPFGLFLGSGITFLIGLQAFINIGVVTGVLPNKGLPLPFISYGGSNLLMMLTGVGLLLSVARLAREDEAVAAVGKRNKDNPFAPAAMRAKEA
jgi:cell division protein FtsW